MFCKERYSPHAVALVAVQPSVALLRSTAHRNNGTHWRRMVDVRHQSRYQDIGDGYRIRVRSGGDLRNVSRRRLNCCLKLVRRKDCGPLGDATGKMACGVDWTCCFVEKSWKTVRCQLHSSMVLVFLPLQLGFNKLQYIDVYFNVGAFRYDRGDVYLEVAFE